MATATNDGNLPEKAEFSTSSTNSSTKPGCSLQNGARNYNRIVCRSRWMLAKKRTTQVAPYQ